MVDVPLRHRSPHGLIAGIVRDILLPGSDRVALVQVLVVLLITVAATYLVRRERALMTFTIGLGMTTLGLMALRTLH